ncbi:hypothetical protein ACA910_001760 [Epithemia clementina (nom. ined.)]
MKMKRALLCCIAASISDLVSPLTSSSVQSHGAETLQGLINDGPKWTPKVKDLEERKKLRGRQHDSETIGSLGFHHIEFYCGEAKSVAQIFSQGLGMSVTGSTGQHTGNDQCISYALESGQVRFLLTAPYSQQVSSLQSTSQKTEGQPTDAEFDAPNCLPGFVPSEAHEFFVKHGLAARAIGLHVKSASEAFRASVERGARPVVEPTIVAACPGQVKLVGYDLPGCELAEVQLYGDVVLRFISSLPTTSNLERKEDKHILPFLPHLAPTKKQRPTYGLQRIDHAVGNVPNLAEALERIAGFTGFHEFAEFTPEDIGTTESGLNSVVLASDSEDVLLPLNEPTEGKRKSQILTYLEQNEGAGLQHLALKTDDIFETITHVRRAEEDFVGFELMRRPSDQYYEELPQRLGDQLTRYQYQRLEELGILADADDEGILFQVFTKPIGDRPTFFFEIIQRIGCQYTPEKDSERVAQRPGCGGFGQGNFRELFKSIEDYEKTLKV